MLRTHTTKVLRKPDQLTQQALAVIGLMNMGYEAFDEIALAVGAFTEESVAEYRHLYDEIRGSRDKMIRRWVDVGLPAGYSAYLDGASVLCRLCLHRVNAAPCPMCSVSTSSDEAIGDLSEPHKEEASSPTEAIPGSVEKLMVFRARYEAGEPIFHPLDCSRV